MVRTITPAGLTVAADTNDNTSTTVYLSGGIVGQHFTITEQITATGGLIPVIHERFWDLTIVAKRRVDA